MATCICLLQLWATRHFPPRHFPPRHFPPRKFPPRQFPPYVISHHDISPLLFILAIRINLTLFRCCLLLLFLFLKHLNILFRRTIKFSDPQLSFQVWVRFSSHDIKAIVAIFVILVWIDEDFKKMLEGAVGKRLHIWNFSSYQIIWIVEILSIVIFRYCILKKFRTE